MVTLIITIEETESGVTFQGGPVCKHATQKEMDRSVILAEIIKLTLMKLAERQKRPSTLLDAGTSREYIKLFIERAKCQDIQETIAALMNEIKL